MLHPLEQAISQQRLQLVDTGVIFSAEHVQRSGADRLFKVTPPYWTPSPEQIALIEAELKLYLGRAAPLNAKLIAARLGSYKRQYFGYTDPGRQWILVNGFCEGHWQKGLTWHDRVVLVHDGGLCFFNVRYDLSSSRFEQLQINGEARCWRGERGTTVSAAAGADIPGPDQISTAFVLPTSAVADVLGALSAAPKQTARAHADVP